MSTIERTINQLPARSGLLDIDAYAALLSALPILTSRIQNLHLLINAIGLTWAGTVAKVKLPGSLRLISVTLGQ